MVSYLLDLGLTFSFPLLFERLSVCLSFVYLETMFGSHRSRLARYIGPLLVFLSEMGSCLSWNISLFFPKQLHAALILAYISSLVVPNTAKCLETLSECVRACVRAFGRRK